jgi:1,4-dihydroxy-2-naphthoate octaprenyltransferase
MATLLSESAVVLEYRLLLGGAALVIAAAFVSRGLPWWCLGAALPALLGLRSAARARPGLDGPGWTMRLIDCVQLHLLTGLTLSLGFVLSAIR